MRQTSQIPRIADGDGFTIHFSGGNRASKVGQDSWRIEPVLLDGKACYYGPISKESVYKIAGENGFSAVSFQHFGWNRGEYYSSWSPIVSGQTDHMNSPASQWSRIAGNIRRGRTSEFFALSEVPDFREVESKMDDSAPDESFASYISFSLRSIDISIEQISDYYHEQLVNNLSAGRVNGEISSNSLDQSLFAHVHSFFLHLGAARDYLAALIAYRLGLDHRRIDSLARLADALNTQNLQEDSLLQLLISTGNLVSDTQKHRKLRVGGWLQEATALRNELVHKRPYGSKFVEHFGRIVRSKCDAKYYTYFRPIHLSSADECDVFDVVHHHYKSCAHLMLRAALLSEYNSDRMTITASDLISFELDRG